VRECIALEYFAVGQYGIIGPYVGLTDIVDAILCRGPERAGKEQYHKKKVAGAKEESFHVLLN